MNYNTTFFIGRYTCIYMSSGSPILLQIFIPQTPTSTPTSIIPSISNLDNNLLFIYIILSIIILFVCIAIYLYISKSKIPIRQNNFNLGE
jgi:hypothetical protein